MAVDIAALRLFYQGVSSATYQTALDVVQGLGAVQAQDYNSALWTIGLRLPHSTVLEIEEALKQKQIIRTWSLRGTLHLLPADDVRWMLSIVAPAAKARFARDCLQEGLDEAEFSRIFAATERVLEGKALSRKAFLSALSAEGINTEGRRASLIMYRTAQDGLLCLGESGKEDTYSLLAECAPKQRELSRDEALAEAAKRYFTSHAPASVHDFAWWLGISISEARQAFDSVKSEFVSETIEKQVYWMPQGAREMPDSRAVYLHSGFDEIFLGYKDRRMIVDYEREQYIFQKNGVYRWTIIQNGRVIGTWKRAIKKNKISIEIESFQDFDAETSEAIQRGAKRYAGFLGLALE